MDKDRRRLPPQSSSSIRHGNSPVHGGYSTTPGVGGAFTNGSMNQNAMSMPLSTRYNNASPPRQQLPPPGFGVQNSMNMYQYSEAHHQPTSAFQNFSPFGPTSQEYAVNEKFRIPPNAGYSNFYSQETARRSSIIGQQNDFGVPQMSSIPDQQQYNNNGTSKSYRLDGGMELLNGSTSQHPVTGTGSSSTYARTIRSEDNSNKNQLINPVIDNIVGSMSMSNGTYTHFGPAMGTQNFSSERAGPFGRSELREEDVMENIGGTSHSLSSLGSCGSGKESPIGVIGTSSTGVSVRASTPNDGMDMGSRPQTPGKPSYSEILAKNASQNGFVPSTSSQQHRKLSSASPSPVLSKTSVTDSFQTAGHQNHRKSVDYLNMSSNSSAASSSCPSASSSPVAKQKSIPQSIVGRLFNPTKGKENNTDSSKAGNPKSTPSNTPTHQKKGGQLKGDLQIGSQKSNERKVLSSSENRGTGGGNKSKSSVKAAAVSPGQSNFDFEIEDLDEKSEWGWKTYTSRGRNHCNRPTNASSGTGDKRYTDENFGITDDGITNGKADGSENNNEVDDNDSRRDSTTEKRSSSQPSGSLVGSNVPGNSTTAGGSQSQRKGREKEKAKTRKDDRNNAVRRVERIVYLWAAHMISAAAWLLKLVTDVITLSISVGSTLMEDFHLWWVTKALPTCFNQVHSLKDKVGRCCWKIRQTLSWSRPFRKIEDPNSPGNTGKRNGEELLAALGPERNIALPSNGDEALKRLLSVKGQDPYSILGIRSDSSDETIRRYYKKQAVLVHPDKNLVLGAEEAFKILARAFELIGEPIKRTEYHQKLLEAHAKEKVYGEIGKLLDQLRKKMEIATSSIRCTKCNSRHKKNKTDRPLFAARYCAQCGIHHGAREGELWAERSGWFGVSWNYFACMDSHVWEINEWAKCQKKNLQHIKPDSHCVMYRLVAGNGNNQQGQQQASNGNGGQAGDGHFHVDPEDDWDSLINNLCKSPGGVPGGGHFYQQGKGAGGSNCCPGGTNAPSSNASASGKKRKGKRK